MSPGNVKVRQATVDDAPVLAKIRFDFRSSTASVSVGADEFLQRCSAWMERNLASQGPWRCWVVTVDEVIAGNLWLQVIEKIPNPSAELERHAYLSNIYVSEDVRSRGLGSLLLASAIDWCKTNGVHAAFLWPTERSRSLYQRFGFAVRDDLLELIVDQSG